MKAPPSPIPGRLQRFESFAYGLFVHFGLYSLPARGEWYWHHHQLKREDYLGLFNQFNPREFDARALVRQAKAAGMRYICLGTRHHEGFSLYDTRGLNTFDAPSSPAGRDLVREFSEACEAEGMGKFFYHTTIDWWHGAFAAPERWDEYLRYLSDSVEILATQYGRVDGFWFDGNWWHRDRDWKEDALYALVRRHQPEAIIVNNSSTSARGRVAHPMLDVATFEQGAPRDISADSEHHLPRERCETFNSHWGIARHDFSMKSPAEIIRILAECRRFGANLLLNVGPTAEGAIPPYEAASLEMVGRWIKTCGNSIYEGRPMNVLCRGDDFVLRDPSEDAGAFYYFAHQLEINGNVHLHSGEPGRGLRTIQGSLPRMARVSWTDNGQELAFTQDEARGILAFDATAHPYGEQRVVRVARLEPAP
jgi:alpha-L-fucosidase